jgi:sulfoxide reductase catalytic subunit YedY
MLIRKPADIPYSEITPKSLYLNRRKFLAAAGFLAAGRAAFAGPTLPVRKSPFSTDEKQTPRQDVTHYNNFYEFGTGKDQPAVLAQRLKTSPWTISVEGAVQNPRKYSVEEIAALAPLEERIYRHRCVEGWSIVVPWIGVPLAAVLQAAAPRPNARFVAFQSLYDPGIMLSDRWAGIPFPYVEGLRLDEAMHPLTTLAVGMYGDMLPRQDGAPIRLVVPWKYGFKSIKSIVKIKLTEKQPPTTWNMAASNEYGFYSNVNPEVDHPRWSQKKERRLGEFFKRDTLMFNGYGDQVARLYSGMDLRKNF